ncbi:MAG TPA: hypothetical protein VHT95_10905 [Vicinamibacterales bacterium]|nr:hypothetical protein [Vicinamibacterales bacterium]
MPKRSRKTTTPRLSAPLDANQAAFFVTKHLDELTQEIADGKDPLAVLLGRRGGLKGGHARAAKMTKKQRAASASTAANVRWELYRAQQTKKK